MKNKINTKQKILASLCGVIVGFINGFFGGGGGMICVPFLQKFLKMEDKNAHATTLCVVLPISIISSVIYVFSSNVDINILLPISVSSIIFALVGCLLLKKFNSKLINILFAVIMCMAGVKLVIM